MKSKLFIGLILFSVMASGCDNTSKIPYQLKDTWGANGNWDNKALKVAKAPSSPVKKAVPAKPKSAPVKGAQAPKTPVVKKEIPVNTVSTQTSEPVSESKNIYRWQKVGSSGIFKANYVKSIPDENLGFSYGIINNTKMDANFKKDYKAKLVKSIAGASIISDKEEVVKTKKAWSIVFNFDKDGTKVQQKQLFIPINKDLMLVNFVASQKGFNKAEPEFKSITSNLKL